jgi:hypothetical protein
VPRALLSLAELGDETLARHRVELFQIFGGADGEVGGIARERAGVVPRDVLQPFPDGQAAKLGFFNT